MTGTCSRLWVVAIVALVAGCAGQRGQRETMPDPLADISGAELYDRGLSVAAGGDLIRAEQYFVAAMEKGHPETTVLPMLIRVCIASSRHSAALSHAEPYLRAHPSEWRLRLLVATLKLGLGEVEDARLELHRVLVASPDEPAAHYVLGMLYREELSDDARAQTHFARYLEVDPEGVHAEEVRAALDAGTQERVMVNIERAGPESDDVEEPVSVQPREESGDST